MPTLILAEKPSVARAIAKALGRPTRADGYLQVENYLVTWAVGHLVALAPPEAYHPSWKSWKLDELPMLPDSWKLVANKRTKKQFSIVKSLMQRNDVDRVIFATDAGAEGELIARWIYEKCGCKKPAERLWIASVTTTAILEGMKQLQPAAAYDRLYESAAARARSDWTVGLNATRAVTCALRYNDSSSPTYTLGRVQTPVLKKIVDREKEIETFEPEIYYEILGIFEDKAGYVYSGKWTDPETGSSRLASQEQAEKIVDQVKGQSVDRVEIQWQEQTILPPTLLSLTNLQRQASTRLGLTVAQVTDIAQVLYEKGMISYPRTADSLVTPDVAASFPSILQQLAGSYHSIVPASPRNLAIDSRYVGPVTDHHGIIPTGQRGKIEGAEAALYDYIVRVFIAAHHESGLDRVRDIITIVKGERFYTREGYKVVPGWRTVFGAVPEALPDDIVPTVINVDASWTEEATQPPSRYTEAAIIKEMERCRLGTAATRAETIEKLKKQAYITLEGKSLVPTEKGLFLIEQLGDAPITSAELTGQWETQLEEIQKGTLSVAEFERGIQESVREMVQAAAKLKDPTIVKAKAAVMGSCPACKQGQVLHITGKEKPYYMCNRRQDGCRFFIAGTIAGQTITQKDIQRLLQRGKMKEKSYQFKTGKRRAVLYLTSDGSTEFEFPESMGKRVARFFGLGG
ncbi:type IA DNA topoisomerase [Aneurinibacillus aneurinilyticus]|uniref:DNA topoisomerase n=1 Tax=Aneurinibacillus aneurinilyticus ATCC 12856 TaxID=649747 RepID=U1WFC2_ANEAE|nr:type IA DNA topoisomerase [Aneurinibacillus aneurinilyticus]ERI07249.1 DNA topoisomerase [Aneurinibacillus aneurinilyticus ATCC 12856]MED0709653.1 DNA topoisomerase [Aneurinibacillus aneurinilyticus]MED0726431.1 DNA topoisomerase [Aneurinibacillus aneurinilyticus]MED0730395.1 DNA topoisomerase [Aneurinibacillus aneurinilyticus]MED0739224.1 DNA topoisomerase [Aneurinibacillus aneurinilyticus]